jgi:hypothetical protein
LQQGLRILDGFASPNSHGCQKRFLKAVFGIGAVANESVDRSPYGRPVAADYFIPIDHSPITPVRRAASIKVVADATAILTRITGF